MTGKPEIDASVRDKIIRDPDVILDDRDVMRALTAANTSGIGENVVDIRGIAIERLETRLSRLEDTHRSVISAAYENLAGTNQIHRAVLRMLDPTEFADFLGNLGAEVADIMRVDTVRLVLETVQSGDDPAIGRMDGVLKVVSPGFIADYVGGNADAQRPVTLRQLRPETDMLYGEASAWIRSEACLTLDFGEGRLPGLLLLGSEDPHQFKANQGTDLLAFFGGVFERAMRRWLS